MTILAVIQQVCPVIGLDIPTQVFASTDREDIELAALANTMAKRIADDDCEWQLFKALATYTGDGAATTFALPSDYVRMPKKSSLYSSSMASPLTHIADSDAWLELITISPTMILNSWTLIGGQMNIRPALAVGVTVSHYYQSSLIVAPATGLNKTAFTADADAFRLAPQTDSVGLTKGEELLKLGMIWQWKANKGWPYAEDMANYEAKLSRMITDDKGSRVLMIGQARGMRGVNVAYPFPISA